MTQRLDGQPCVQSCGGRIVLDRERYDEAAKVWVGHLHCEVCGMKYLDMSKAQRQGKGD